MRLSHCRFGGVLVLCSFLCALPLSSPFTYAFVITLLGQFLLGHRNSSRRALEDCTRPGCPHGPRKDEFFVERIVGRRPSTTPGVPLYMIKWEGVSCLPIRPVPGLHTLLFTRN